MKLEIIKPFGPSVYPFTDSDDKRGSVSFNAAIDLAAASL
jgi:hypothetical protein